MYWVRNELLLLQIMENHWVIAMLTLVGKALFVNLFYAKCESVSKTGLRYALISYIFLYFHNVDVSLMKANNLCFSYQCLIIVFQRIPEIHQSNNLIQTYYYSSRNRLKINCWFSSAYKAKKKSCLKETF